MSANASAAEVAPSTDLPVNLIDDHTGTGTSAKVIVKVVSHINEKGAAIWKSAEEVVPSTGLPVNLIVGQMGTGKTSLIQLMGGGCPTAIPTIADTKHCSLYKVVKEGKEYLLLKSVGLLENASTSRSRKAFISDIVKFIKGSNLNCCRVFFTVPVGTLDVEGMNDGIKELFEGLGGEDSVSLVSFWVITKCNQERGSSDSIFQALSKHELGMAIICHGIDNQKQLFKKMVAMTAGVEGLPKAAMKSVVDPDQPEPGGSPGSTSVDDEEFAKGEDQLRELIGDAGNLLARGSASRAQKQGSQEIIEDAGQELADCSALWREGARASANRRLKMIYGKLSQKLIELSGCERRTFCEYLSTIIATLASFFQHPLRLCYRRKYD